LAEDGYVVRQAADGVSCLQAIEAFTPSLVLLDVSMPGLDGFQTLKRLRASKQRDIPVILVTGERLDAESIGSGLLLGAEEYLQKPVRPAELRARVRALIKLSQAKRELDAMKREQTAMLVHDLKQPLAIIALHAEFIEGEGADASLAQSAIAIRNACRQMELLVASVLALSRLEAGHLTLERSPTRLDEIVERSVDEMRVLGVRRGITVAVRADTAALCNVDRDKVVQVVQNLVGNALKFTPAGGEIAVSVRQADNEALVAVEDTGPGLDGEDPAALFERWHQNAAGRRAGGSGLGLAIARAIVEAHGGRIGAGPRCDGARGARFWFTMPLVALSAVGARATTVAQ
jgi:signal transduction histidine kinase